MNMINKTVANKLGDKMPDSNKSHKMMDSETPQQKQAAAKMALRKQLEKTLLQVIIFYQLRNLMSKKMLPLGHLLNSTETRFMSITTVFYY